MANTYITSVIYYRRPFPYFVARAFAVSFSVEGTSPARQTIHILSVATERRTGHAVANNAQTCTVPISIVALMISRFGRSLSDSIFRSSFHSESWSLKSSVG